MEWSREYLQRHNIHRVLEDCVEDLVVEQPPTKEGIVKTIVNRLDATRRRFDNPQQRVVLVLSDPGAKGTTELVAAAAKRRGATLVDGNGRTGEDIRDELNAGASQAFVINFPKTIGDAIALEGSFGKPHKVIAFESNFVKEVSRSDPSFLEYAKGVNAVAELYSAKGQVVKVAAGDTQALSSAFD